ncbi:hypothetical protein GO613_01345 [Azoarcus communis]|uniref:hypothetical protein n=1 Tax=Parazoarcus communis TaxID=41977 RepID=UPI00145958DD|nr:hypothetical protein [Parazoarcus communis]NMG46754.1 hypothetical protein [Parazoarcus communis]
MSKSTQLPPKTPPAAQEAVPSSHVPGFEPIHVDDLIGCVRCSGDSFEQIELLFRLIKAHAGETGTVKTLADIGVGLAVDGSSFADVTREKAEQGGVRS